MRLEGTPLNYGRAMRLCGCVGLAKRRLPAKTRVGRYVQSKVPRLASKVAVVLQRAVARGTAKVRALAQANQLTKAYRDLSGEDKQIVQAIIDEIDPERLSTDLVETITPDMIAAYKVAGIQGAMDLMSGSPTPEITSQIDEGAVAFAQRRGGELIKDLAQTTLDDLQDFLSEAVAAGMSSEDLAAALDELGSFGEVRSITIARTELAFAHVQGNVEGWKAADVGVERKRWILGDTHEITDECDEAADAGDIPIDEEFAPGIDFPPAHPNCICDVVPVLADDTTDEGD